MELAGKSALITGASRGLGRSLAVALTQAGMRVALTARDRAGLAETADLCRAVEYPGSGAARGPQVVTIGADVTIATENRAMVEEAVAALGGLDLFVANAGVSMWADFQHVEDLALYDQLMRVNYLAVVTGIHAALPHLVASGGRIVAISTAQVWTGMPYHTGYAASKAALQGFLDSLMMEMGDRISLLGVYPGWIRDTDLRTSALGSDGQPLGPSRRTHNRLSVTADECSASVVKGLRRDRAMVFVPGYLRLLMMARPFVYPLLQRILGGAVHSQKHGAG